MTDESIDLTTIGLFSLVGLPYTLKFLWAPFLDRWVPPLLGRRRGWILVGQVALAGALLLLAYSQPKLSPLFMAFTAMLVTFFSSTQDVAIDAYRRDVLEDEELGLGSALAVNGYRIGMLVAGAGALALADHFPWKWVYGLMAAVMLLSSAFTFFAPEPVHESSPPKSLRQAVVQPFIEFLSRDGAWLFLTFILLYKVGDALASTQFTPFYLLSGYTKTEIAAVAKVFGFWATIVGGLIGGIFILRQGFYRSLWVFGVLQAVSTLAFAWLSLVPAHWSALAIVIGFENLTSGMGTSAYAGFMAKLCNRQFTATQYALLSSLMGIPRVVIGSSGGWLATQLGWYGFFILCTLAAIPGLLLLLKIRRFSVS